MLRPLSKNRLKFYQKLNQKKYRDQEKLYLISGLRAVQSALENDKNNCVELIFEESKEGLLLNLETGSVKQQSTVSSKDFRSLCDEKSPQGICLVAKKPTTDFELNKIKNGPILLLDRISDPGNLGTIIRSAAWFGIEAVLLSPGSADPFQPKVVRASVGAINVVQIFEEVGIGELEQIKSQKDFSFFATDVSGGTELSSTKFNKTTLIMFGSEAHGLANEYKNLADSKLLIKKIGNGESLNVANAAAIIMYQATINK
jgi:RNA methyltransferase, TrmH family